MKIDNIEHNVVAYDLARNPDLLVKFGLLSHSALQENKDFFDWGILALMNLEPEAPKAQEILEGLMEEIKISLLSSAPHYYLIQLVNAVEYFVEASGLKPESRINHQASEGRGV